MSRHDTSNLIRTGSIIEFDYNNWRGDRHLYEVVVESIEFGFYAEDGASTPPGGRRWVLHGHTLTRDGSPREEMGPTRRRTFTMDGMENIRVAR